MAPTVVGAYVALARKGLRAPTESVGRPVTSLARENSVVTTVVVAAAEFAGKARCATILDSAFLNVRPIVQARNVVLMGAVAPVVLVPRMNFAPMGAFALIVPLAAKGWPVDLTPVMSSVVSVVLDSIA